MRRNIYWIILASLLIVGFGHPLHAAQSVPKSRCDQNNTAQKVEAERFICFLLKEASDAVRTKVDENALAKLYDIAFDTEWIVKTVNRGRKAEDGGPLIDPQVIKNIIVNVFAEKFSDFADATIILDKPRWETGLVQVNGTIIPKKGEFEGKELATVWRMDCEKDQTGNPVCKLRDIVVESVGLIDILSKTKP